MGDSSVKSISKCGFYLAMDVAKEEGLVTQEQREKTKEGARRSSEVDKKEQEAGAAAEESEKAEREAQTGVCGSVYQGLPQCHFG